MNFFRTSILPLATAISFAADPIQKLPALRVFDTTPAADAKYQLPQSLEGVTALEIAERVNVLDPEDALKYLPSLFLRKRNAGDTQAVMATRVWGVSSSARSLVYADGALLSALIANNNNIGGPRWGLVAPAEIERIDVLYGPFAAAYPGNAMGAVVEITTRQPEKFEGSLEHTLAGQNFRQYGTRDRYWTRQTAATAGQRIGRFSFRVSGNYQDSHSQPLNYVTSTTLPAGVSGGFAEKNKFGQPAPVVGASGLLHTRMANAKIQAGYDFSPALHAAYTFGLWHNDGDATAETYLRDAAGQPTFAGLAGFASGTYQLVQQHTSHSVSLKSDTRGAVDFEAVATFYRMNRDHQRLPATANTNGLAFGPAGRVAVLDGTGWSTLDLKGTWRPFGVDLKHAAHLVTLGAHEDRYRLNNPTFNSPDWRNGGRSSVATEGDGRTRTQALWAQDVWRLGSELKITFGARYERWHASDGLNANGAVVVRQPDLQRSDVSPKVTVAWTTSPGWVLTTSVAQAYRFATASELYQLVSTGSTFTSPDPNLKPDDVLATEVRLEHTLPGGRMRVSAFQDDVHDAIIAQFQPLIPGSTQLFSFASNVDHVRARGIELAVDQDDVLVRGLGVSGSVTYLDARTRATKGQGQFGSAIGKRLPNIPGWRASFVTTWRPDSRWVFSLAGRYSGMLTTTLDAADTHSNTWQGFAAWFVADAHVLCRIDRHWSASIGADNLLNRNYFLFHPFPQRTVMVQLKYGF